MPRRVRARCGLEEGLCWWFIPERIKSLGHGCGLDVHWEIWCFFWKNMQEAECIVLDRTVARRAGFGLILLT